MLRLTFVSLVLTFIVSGRGVFANTISSADLAQGLYGLEEVPFDSLSHLLWFKLQNPRKPSGKAPTPQLDSAAVVDSTAIVQITNKKQIFEQLMVHINKQTLASEQDCLNLASQLAEFRNTYREQAPIVSRNEFRDILFLLQMMEEEVLYLGFSHFHPSIKSSQTEASMESETPVFWRWVPSEKSKWSFVANETLPLRKIPIANGDVLLSKASGAGSSSFIALTGDAPHIYSHATIGVITEINGHKELVSPEADITDGVKLRAFEDYKAGAKTRLFVYRLASLDAEKKAQIGASTERFVKKMYAITPDPFKQKVFDYDFDLNPDTEGSYYCAAVPCRIYRDTNLDDALNPYPRELWGEPTQIRRAVYDFLEIPHRPSAAPGDLESNRAFALVSSEIRLDHLELERVELAAIDSMFDLLSIKKDIVNEMIARTDKLGDSPIKTEELEVLVKAGLMPRAALEKIPQHIKPKQLIFFGYLNEVFMPKIRKLIMDQLTQKKREGKIMGLQELRNLAYQIEESRASELLKDLRIFIEQIEKIKNSQAQRTSTDKALRCVKALSNRP